MVRRHARDPASMLRKELPRPRRKAGADPMPRALSRVNPRGYGRNLPIIHGEVKTSMPAFAGQFMEFSAKRIRGFYLSFAGGRVAQIKKANRVGRAVPSGPL